MSHMSNNTGISLPLAVWLATEEYDFRQGTRRAISATSLLKPVRQILLRERLTPEERDTPDVSEFIASRLGHAIHDSIEKAWKSGNLPKTLMTLGYPADIANNVEVNPKNPDPAKIQIWLEQRVEREFMGYVISGKFDMVLNGELQDFKTTSTYATKGNKDEDYRIQGSLYRWLNPERITTDYMNIQWIFTDWSKARLREPGYPQQRVMEHRVELMSIAETESWMRLKIRALEDAADLPESQIPECTDKDLWRSEPRFKYFSDVMKAQVPGARSTKNFDTLLEASDFMQNEKGGKGIVITVPGKVKACGYCPAFNICTQKNAYEHG